MNESFEKRTRERFRVLEYAYNTGHELDEQELSTALGLSVEDIHDAVEYLTGENLLFAWLGGGLVEITDWGRREYEAQLRAQVESLVIDIRSRMESVEPAARQTVGTAVATVETQLQQPSPKWRDVKNSLGSIATTFKSAATAGDLVSQIADLLGRLRT